MNVEPFNLVDYPKIEANHVAITILYSGLNGKETWRLEFGPKVRKSTSLQSESVVGVVTVTHSNEHEPIANGSVSAGPITTFTPFLSVFQARVEGVRKQYDESQYHISGENHGSGKNCRDFVRSVLVELTGEAVALETLETIPLTPSSPTAPEEK